MIYPPIIIPFLPITIRFDATLVYFTYSDGESNTHSLSKYIDGEFWV